MEENINGVRILRSRQYIPSNPTFFKRILHLISFTFGSFLNLFKTSKPDLIISIVPFTTSILLGWFLKLRYKSKLWVHIQDFEFDAASQTGYGSKTNRWFKILFSIEKELLNKANITSTISYSMINILKLKTDTESYFLPNWIDENQINPDHYNQHQLLSSNKTKILYSGNIGEKQDWGIFLEFCQDINPEKYQIIVVGDGAKKIWLLDQIQKFTHVSYHPPVPYEELSDLLCSSQFHILFQKAEVIDTVMPSKILGMMASARPSIVIGSQFSEINKIFTESEGGVYFNTYSKTIIEAIDQLRNNPSKYSTIGNNARKFVVANFSKKQILEKMLHKFSAIRK